MTPEEWKKVENTLSSPYGRVEFKIDGYDITIICVVEKPLHYCLAVYVDGKIKVEWISQDCEIRRKFYQKHTKSLLDSKQKKLWSVRKKILERKFWKNPLMIGMNPIGSQSDQWNHTLLKTIRL